MPEVIEALEMGYQILKIDEIWHWKEKSDKLFWDFLLRCLKAKVESSGFPDECQTDEQKQAYVEEQNEAYDFDLELSNVEKNASIRTLAKQNLNQFW